MIAKAAGDKNYGCRCLYIGGHMAQAREWKSESIISLRNRINIYIQVTRHRQVYHCKICLRKSQETKKIQ